MSGVTQSLPTSTQLTNTFLNSPEQLQKRSEQSLQEQSSKTWQNSSLTIQSSLKFNSTGTRKILASSTPHCELQINVTEGNVYTLDLSILFQSSPLTFNSRPFPAIPNSEVIIEEICPTGAPFLMLNFNDLLLVSNSTILNYSSIYGVSPTGYLKIKAQFSISRLLPNPKIYSRRAYIL
jgi:hypothetical protein